MSDDDLMNLTAVSKLLGLSGKNARRLWDDKKLEPALVHPKTGLPLFRRADVESYARKRREKCAVVSVSSWTVDQCKRAFALFRENAPLARIVEEVGLAPEQVKALFLEFSTPLTIATATPPERLAEDEARAARLAREKARAYEEQQDAMARAQREADAQFLAQMRAIEKQREVDRVAAERAQREADARHQKALAGRPDIEALRSRLAELRASKPEQAKR